MAAWVPLCMDMAEHAAWMAANQRLSGDWRETKRAARPCDDCPLGFAAEMRAIGRCNGTPGGVEEDDEMDQGDVDAAGRGRGDAEGQRGRDGAVRRLLAPAGVPHGR